MNAIHKSAIALWLACAAAACASAEKVAGEPQQARAVTPGASTAVPLEQMRLAVASSKPGAPVELRYAVTGALGQSTTLELAIIPRASGQNLRADFLPSEGVAIESGKASLVQQKADRDQALRHVLKVRADDPASAQLRVLVSMEVEGARFFTIFTAPIE